MINPEADFEQIRSTTGNGLYASNAIMFKDAIFGRDSLEMAEDILLIKPEIAQEVILTLAARQGSSFYPRSEEEPGKIYHEYRNLFVDGRKINEKSEEILRNLIKKWGKDDDDEFTYYGSVDATPLYIKLIQDYCRLYGQKILGEQITDKSGKTVTINDSLKKALGWLENKLSTSVSGLLEYQTHNREGLLNQTWKDSTTAFIGTDGQPANISVPIAPIGVQGLVYDALSSSNDSKLIDLAKKIREITFAKLWLPDQNYFAQAIGVNTPTSDPALLMSSDIFNDLPQMEKQKYVSSIVKTIYSSSFLTRVGIRCRAKELEHLAGYQDYHGSWAVWPKETFDIAKGLEKQGFPLLARQLYNRIINACIITDDYPELLYVNPKNGDIYFGEQSKLSDTKKPTVIFGNVIPETIQGWTLTAAMAILENKIFVTNVVVPDDWQKKLEQELLSKEPQIGIVTSDEELSIYPHLPYLIDQEKGREIRTKIREALLSKYASG